MPLWPDGPIEPAREKEYFRTLEDIAYILASEDGPAVNCGRRCRRECHSSFWQGALWHAPLPARPGDATGG